VRLFTVREANEVIRERKPLLLPVVGRPGAGTP
jgi:hypothetical protein